MILLKKQVGLFLKLVLLLVIVLFFGCSDFDSSSAIYEEPLLNEVTSKTDTLDGMVRIFANGASTFLGTMDSDAKINERPLMTVNFSYDFSIARKETTCGEFKRLMKNKIKCDYAFNPITNITYYDAVLMANARSKVEKFDTAYTYESATFDLGGHCISLNGLVFHPEVEAYRLPTEAEWILVARQGWSYIKGWTAENSYYSIHRGCEFPPNKLAVCDMVGNVMEWVNDWLGSFQDTVVSNFVGAPDAGGVGERVVKGGSFKDIGAAIQPYSRGDVYMVTSSTKQVYIGFRLAFGAIKNPTWIDRLGNSNNNRVTPIATTAALHEKTSSYKMKLVFRNDVSKNLMVMDYSGALPTVVEISDTIDAYHPDISPNGNWVAFCTGVEGISGKSNLYVRRLDSLNKEPIKLEVENAAIPRFRVLENGDTVIVYVSDARNNKELPIFKQQSTWQVPFSNGKFGNPIKLLDGSYHGGISIDNKLAVTGSSLLRTHSTINNLSKDSVWYGGEQACNVSLKKDKSKRVLFLDFGGKIGRDFAKKKYATHEQILIADSLGNLIQTIQAPKGYTFDHSEWSYDGIVATLVNINGSHKKIVYILPEDSSILTLAEGDEIWHPAFWQKEVDNSKKEIFLDLDSAGIYYREASEEYVHVFREKMETFWTTKDSIEIVAMGSSRTMYGVDIEEFSTKNVLNMSYPGADMYDISYIFKNYLLNHSKRIKYLILEVAPDMFFRTYDDHWGPMYSSVPGIKYDVNHGFWRNGLPDGFIEAVKDCPTFANKSILPYDEKYRLPSKSWGPAEIVIDSNNSARLDKKILESSFITYESIVESANERGIKVIGVIYPRHPDYRKTGTFGAYGPSRSFAKEIIDDVSKLEMIILDENKWGNHDYTNEMAYDYDHLSNLGAKQLTHRLDSLLKTLE